MESVGGGCDRCDREERVLFKRTRRGEVDRWRKKRLENRKRSRRREKNQGSQQAQLGRRVVGRTDKSEGWPKSCFDFPLFACA